MICGIPISFPFKPYDVQEAYMEKVIECLQNGYNGVLESPTGTGKTLCLLCSSLAWLLVKKAQIQINAQMGITDNPGSFMNSLENKLKNVAGKQTEGSAGWGMPKIIYASRTHSQLSQAMQELKRSNYRSVKAAVLGSRDQMCIHPEVSKETNNANKVTLCQARVKSKTCYFYSNVESKKEDISVKEGILDIEDLVKVGKKLKCCPYYLAKEMKQNADIIFLPYNYLLDQKSRKVNGVELTNNVIILDEAHNIERICEESASLQISSTEIALCIEEVTHIMKALTESQDEGSDFTTGENSQPKDFTPDDLCTLKTIFLALERAVDAIPVKPGDGITFDGGHIFELLAKAEINETNCMVVTTLVENLVQYLTMTGGTSPFQRKGNGLQKFADLLNICFCNTKSVHRERVSKCYKVHVHIEEKKRKKSDSWSVMKGPTTSTAERIISYWCFSPGFGMKQLMDHNVRCVILTSGTLAPLKPLILELGIPIQARLENPHIVTGKQIFVKIISQGPDAQILNSNYENRNNPKYITSLGRTILSFCRVVPDGLLVFFPSYPIMAKCQQDWQVEGIWGNISDIKPIYVEPQRKDTFNATMADFYTKINDPNSRGACFMAVCRGKVSEGLDFADMNGRAVIVTGLPFPPLKDPRIVLKKKYLEEQRSKDNEFLSGDEWYSLEASRAVNQAIGRVIRHKNDYGAILLCDTRFNNARLKNQLSSWLKGHLTIGNKFGETVGELCRFFKNAEKTLPSPKLKPLTDSEFNDITKNTVTDYLQISKSNIRTIPKQNKGGANLPSLPKSNEVLGDIQYYKNMKCVSENRQSLSKASDLFSALDSCSDAASIQNIPSSSNCEVTIHKRDRSSEEIKNKKKKLKMLPFGFDSPSSHDNSSSEALQVQKLAPKDLIEFVKCVKTSLTKDIYKEFQMSISSYKLTNNYDEFVKSLDGLFFPNPKVHYLLRDMGRFLKDNHKKDFGIYCQKLSTA